MRKLIIKRHKSFVACLMKSKVYIEDPVANEIAINDVPCRKLGDLKNGEEKTFLIGDEEARVFVIVDKLSKNYCNEYYQLEAGIEDVTLTGKHKYNPANGNAFRFDNNNNPDVVANRKKGTKKGLIILILAIIAGAVAGCMGGSNLFASIPEDSVEKVFSGEGMSIVLTDSFYESDMESGYTVVYDSANVAVFALKEDFSLIEGGENYTLEQYGEAVLISNSMTDTEYQHTDGLTYFTYDATNPETNVDYTYNAFVFKADDAFWLVQFATLKEEADTYHPQIIEWAKTISFYK